MSMGARAVAVAILVIPAPALLACGSTPTATSTGDGGGAGPDEASSEGASGGSDAPATGFPLDPVTSLGSLTPAQKATLCDWIAQQFGGYDSRGVCTDAATGGLQGPVDQSECVVDLLPPATCQATVAQLQACVRSEIQNACDWPAVSPTPPCVFLTASACGGTADAGRSD